MFLSEEEVMAIARFYKETRTWRKEMALSGYRVEAGYRGGNYSDQVLDVRDGHQGWHVHVEGRGYRVQTYTNADFTRYKFKTPDEVMDFLSERLRDE